jgi:CubicO group peptidase (beta-lactamase class C family)
MKNVGFRIAICLLLLSPFGWAQAAGPQEKPATPSEQMDELFDFWNRLDQPGFAVVVVKEGQVVYRNVFGLACQEHAVPIRPDSVFNSATLAQVFVGQAVAMLEGEGKLSLDEDVRKFIPDVPDFGTPVTLRHLLTHSSGLRDWLSVVQLAGRETEEITMEKVLAIVKAQKRLLFPPGSRVQYSNTDYDLLAETVGRASGLPFSDWAWENIFKPLKMTRTLFRDNCRAIIDNQAFSYNFTSAEYLRGEDHLSVFGSHSLFTTIADLAKWLLNLETGQVGGPELFARMFTAGTLNDGRSSFCGYGLNVTNRPAGRQVSQMGTWAGSGATLHYFPEERFGFAVLGNWDYTPVSGFARDIINIYLPPPAAPPEKPAPPAQPSPPEKSVKVDPKILDRYAGDYRLGPRQVLTISREGDRLRLGVPGQTFALTALSENEFFLDIAQARIVFQMDKGGEVRQFIWKQGGAEQIAQKIILVKPTPKELMEFAGSYFNEEVNVSFDIARRGDGLVLVPPGQGEVPLVPDVKDRFVSRASQFPTIIFQRDDEGRVTGFVIDDSPVRDLVFKRR